MEASVSVKDEQCEQEMEKCHTTHGKCTTVDSGQNIECVCPTGQGYSKTEGCKGELYIRIV